MPDILHRFEVKASPAEAYRALATLEGLAGWWTTDTRGSAAIGGVIEFVFGTRGKIDMKVLEAQPDKRVLWQVLAGPDAWAGTTVGFDLRQDGDYTVVLFKHEGWKEASEMMHHCTTKWAVFLLSIKALVEAGTGTPFPNDVHITGSGD
jgi:uncharacterized protein YndB with AHSA1/START domain